MRTQSLVASLLLHAAGVVLLFTLAVSPSIPEPPTHPAHVALVAPLSRPPRLVRPRLSRLQPRPARILPSPPLPRPVAPNIAIDLPAAPVLEAPRPSLPTLELPRTPAAPTRPLKTDNLNEVRAVPPEPPAKAVIQAAGFSSVETSPRDVSPQARTSAGAFDSTAVREPAPPPAGITRTGGFSDASIAAPAPAARKPAAESGFTPVEIISKPRPAYSEEARRLQIEGEVLLDMMFGASGEARVVRVVHGLGHGLDENAIAAARAIRFHPALRGGGPVDSTAIVHIIFQLAY